MFGWKKNGLNEMPYTEIAMALPTSGFKPFFRRLLIKTRTHTSLKIRTERSAIKQLLSSLATRVAKSGHVATPRLDARVRCNRAFNDFNARLRRAATVTAPTAAMHLEFRFRASVLCLCVCVHKLNHCRRACASAWRNTNDGINTLSIFEHSSSIWWILFFKHII